MSEFNPTSSGDSAADPELQAALAAAFGDDAMSWTADDDDAFSGGNDADFASAAAAMIAEAESGTATVTVASDDNPLSDLLDRLGAAVGTGAAVAPALLRQGEGEENANAQQNLGPRHVVYQVGDQFFGLPLDGVLEIDRCGEITVLPRTPHWLRGVTNLRGQILSVTDFRNLLEISGSRQTVGEKIIVVHSQRHDASTAVVVDRVIGIRNLKSESGPLAGLNDRVANFASGLATADAATTVLIDPDLLLGCTELQAFMSE